MSLKWFYSLLIISTLLITQTAAINVISYEEEIPITSNDDFFTAAIDYFDIEPTSYRLMVSGAVRNYLNLSLEDIKQMPVTSEIVRLTCIAFTVGAREMTGVANWTGVKLSYILDLAEIQEDKAIDISFHTPDLTVGAYSSSLSIEEAYWDDVILAYEMNEEPLPKIHGFPLRLVCPRFYGYKWIKWIAYINITTYDYIGTYPYLGYDDHPYVDVSGLPIYYPLGLNANPPNPDPRRWIIAEIFVASIAVAAIFGFGVLFLKRKMKTL
ncbi:MAG: hypothetical protein EAX86_10060 [Candidatus Heimdallarchaeota archaeon]|nr:hypothetical protein [Candidatus Heimdallarchaeota archaeon]